ncbi:hypothetical protein LQZ19_09010, partial [Treponema primitia]|uniref:hypothetical protein n=1 Tax=Treponema primitia TaxID=88058 RepID=UPI003981592E
MNEYARLRSVFESLQDEESKEIFLHRLLYCFDNDKKHTNDIIKIANYYEKMRYKDRPTFLDFLNTHNRGEKVIVYGAGWMMGRDVLNVLTMHDIQIECFCDSSQEKQKTLFYGYNVISPETLKEKYKDSTIVISTIEYLSEITVSLVQNGFSVEQLITITGTEDEYFGMPFLRPISNEVYVDAGVFDGKTIVKFLEFASGKYKKVYGFEPDPSNCKKIAHTLKEKEMHSIEIIAKGTWSSEAELIFTPAGTGGKIETIIGGGGGGGRGGGAGKKKFISHLPPKARKK